MAAQRERERERERATRDFQMVPPCGAPSHPQCRTILGAPTELVFMPARVESHQIHRALGRVFRECCLSSGEISPRLKTTLVLPSEASKQASKDQIVSK